MPARCNAAKGLGCVGANEWVPHFCLSTAALAAPPVVPPAKHRCSPAREPARIATALPRRPRHEDEARRCAGPDWTSSGMVAGSSRADRSAGDPLMCRESAAEPCRLPDAPSHPCRYLPSTPGYGWNNTGRARIPSRTCSSQARSPLRSGELHYLDQPEDGLLVRSRSAAPSPALVQAYSLERSPRVPNCQRRLGFAY